MAEIGGVFKSNLVCHLKYFQMSFFKQLAGILDFFTCDRVHDGLSCFLTEKPAEIARAYMHGSCYPAQCQWLTEVQIDEVLDIQQEIPAFCRELCDISADCLHKLALMLDTLLMEMHPLKAGLPFRPVQFNYLQICAKFLKGTAAGMQIYRLLSDLGLKDTLTGIIFVYSSLGIAVTFFILRSYFLTIPKEMEEAAMMDGCGYVGTYFRIIVPIAKPGLATAAIMAFLNNWNEYYFASILLKSKENMTLPALLGQFTTAYSKNLNGMFSAIILIVLPTIIIFCLLSETFVKSLTAGAVKG